MFFMLPTAAWGHFERPQTQDGSTDIWSRAKPRCHYSLWHTLPITEFLYFGWIILLVKDSNLPMLEASFFIWLLTLVTKSTDSRGLDDDDVSQNNNNRRISKKFRVESLNNSSSDLWVIQEGQNCLPLPATATKQPVIDLQLLSLRMNEGSELAKSFVKLTFTKNVEHF